LRRGVAILLLAGLLPAQDAPEEESFGLDGQLVKGVFVKPAIYVRLDPGSRLLVKKDRGFEPTTLDALDEYFRQRIRADVQTQKKLGKSGLVERDGALCSPLVVQVEAHPDTPWRHVIWVLDVCMERNLYKIELCGGGHRTNVLLPPNVVRCGGEPPPPPVLARVEVQSRGAVETLWGPFRVVRPETVTYRIGTETTDDLAGVARCLETVRERAKKSGKADLLFGVVRADRNAPVAWVLDVLDAFLAAGITRGDHLNPHLPTPAERRRYLLPYPKR